MDSCGVTDLLVASEPTRKPEGLERYRLHGSPDSANFIVRMILEELGLPYDYVAVDRLISEQNSEAYRRLNPQGLIPVLEVPGQDAPMFETAAIALHLADAHGCLAPAPASPQRGRFLKWLFFLSNTLHSDLRISFKPERYVRDPETALSLHAGQTRRIAGSFAHLETELATWSGPFLLGQDLSILDHYLAACARWAQIYRNEGKWSLAATPHLRALCERLEMRPTIHRACELEGIEGKPFTEPRPVQLPGTTA
ncbi:Glutathione S-transferase [Labrenzia sp. THAF35]|nr:Glutathione S-transferase [Labrenzia sp. THAF35]